MAYWKIVIIILIFWRKIKAYLFIYSNFLQLAFHTINSSRSAYQSITFKPDFFDLYTISGAQVQCSVLLKVSHPNNFVRTNWITQFLSSSLTQPFRPFVLFWGHPLQVLIICPCNCLILMRQNCSWLWIATMVKGSFLSLMCYSS